MSSHPVRGVRSSTPEDPRVRQIKNRNLRSLWEKFGTLYPDDVTSEWVAHDLEAAGYSAPEEVPDFQVSKHP